MVYLISANFINLHSQPLLGDLEIMWVFFYADKPAARSQAGDAGASATHARIQDYIAMVRTGQYKALHKFHRLLGRVQFIPAAWITEYSIFAIFIKRCAFLSPIYAQLHATKPYMLAVHRAGICFFPHAYPRRKLHIYERCTDF